jgi:Protein of unknown function (DUF3606)
VSHAWSSEDSGCAASDRTPTPPAFHPANLLLLSYDPSPGERTIMAGLKDKRGFIDKERLDLTERKAMEYWMKRWGVTRDQLTAAHRKVGRLTKDIAAELGKKR